MLGRTSINSSTSRGTPKPLPARRRASTAKATAAPIPTSSTKPSSHTRRGGDGGTQSSSEARKSAARAAGAKRRVSAAKTSADLTVVHSASDLRRPAASAEQVRRVIASVSDWARKHRFAMGAAGAVVGISILVASGANLRQDFQRQVMASAMPNVGAVLGGAAGSAAKVVGGAGIAIAGTAFAIPALVIGGLGAAAGGVLGLIGGKLLQKVLEPSLIDWVKDFSGIAIGAALLAWGVRQMLASKRWRTVAATVRKWSARFRHWLVGIALGASGGQASLAH